MGKRSIIWVGVPLALCCVLAVVAPVLMPVVVVLYTAALVLEVPKRNRQPEWLTDTVESCSSLDASLRRLYEQDKLTTAEYVAAIETGKIPAGVKIYGGVSPKSIARVREAQRASYLQPGEQIIPLGVPRSSLPPNEGGVNDSPGNILAHWRTGTGKANA